MFGLPLNYENFQGRVTQISTADALKSIQATAPTTTDAPDSLTITDQDKEVVKKLLQKVNMDGGCPSDKICLPKNVKNMNVSELMKIIQSADGNIEKKINTTTDSKSPTITTEPSTTELTTTEPSTTELTTITTEPSTITTEPSTIELTTTEPTPITNEPIRSNDFGDSFTDYKNIETFTDNSENNFIDINLALKSLLFACLFYILSHKDSMNMLSKVTGKLSQENKSIVMMIIFSLLYYIIVMFI